MDINYLLIHLQDLLDDLSPDHIVLTEFDMRNTPAVRKSADKVEKAVCLEAPVVLSQITGYDHLRALADASQKHLHLRRCAILHLIPDDPGVVKCATTHISQRTDFNTLIINQLVDLLDGHEPVESVKHRTGPRFHFLIQITRQETVLLINAHSRSSEDKALDTTRDESLRTHMTGQERLARSSWSCAYNDWNGGRKHINIAPLYEGTRSDHLIVLLLTHAL